MPAEDPSVLAEPPGKSESLEVSTASAKKKSRRRGRKPQRVNPNARRTRRTAKTKRAKDAAPSGVQIRYVKDLTRDARHRSDSRVFADKTVSATIALDPAVIQVGKPRSNWILCPVDDAKEAPSGPRRYATTRDIIDAAPVKRRPCDAPVQSWPQRRPTDMRPDKKPHKKHHHAHRRQSEEVSKWTQAPASRNSLVDLQRRVSVLEAENSQLRYVRDMTSNSAAARRWHGQKTPADPVFQSVLIESAVSRCSRAQRSAGRGRQMSSSVNIPDAGPLTNNFGTTDVNAVQRQLEYYFGEENLVRDAFIRSQMDARGFVRVSVLAAFPRMQGAAVTSQQITRAAERSPTLELSMARDAGVRNKKLWRCFADPTLVSKNKRKTSSKTKPKPKAEVPAPGSQEVAEATIPKNSRGDAQATSDEEDLMAAEPTKVMQDVEGDNKAAKAEEPKLGPTSADIKKGQSTKSIDQYAHLRTSA